MGLGSVRAVRAELKRRFAGSMEWKQRSGRDYLYRRAGRVEKALGARSAETEAILGAFSPMASTAQGGDAAYCTKLAELVTKYIGKQINGQNRPDSESLVAMDRCDHGDWAAGVLARPTALASSQVLTAARA